MARPLYQNTHLRDTICARATAAGAAALAMVRASGPEAVSIADRVFRPTEGKALSQRPAQQATLGRLRHPETGEEIDECVGVLWRAPHSSTGEDVLELTLHGAAWTTERALEALQAAGARLARPGEFTRRGYENGKLDLAQAEAVCDLIRAQTEVAGRAALAQLSGGLSQRVAEARGRLVPVIAELEAWTDFPEEGLEFSARERLGVETDGVVRVVEGLLARARRGRALREGARVVLAGRPNAGKSSLFNALLRRERALVTPHPGTTRDTIEATVDVAGIPVTLVDTAGLRGEGEAEAVEALGIERTRAEMAGADLVIFCVEGAEPPEVPGEEYEALAGGRPWILALTKADAETRPELLQPRSPWRRHRPLAVVEVSSVSREGLETLEGELARALTGGAELGEAGALVTNRRHEDALRRALDHLRRASEGFASDLSPEFIVVDLTEAAGALDEVTGQGGRLDEDVLDQIFSTFCLGK